MAVKQRAEGQGAPGAAGSGQHTQPLAPRSILVDALDEREGLRPIPPGTPGQVLIEQSSTKRGTIRRATAIASRPMRGPAGRGHTRPGNRADLLAGCVVWLGAQSAGQFQVGLNVQDWNASVKDA